MSRWSMAASTRKLAEKLSILLPARDRKTQVLRSLRGLQRLEAVLRICVADSGSTDGTAEAVAREFPAIDVLRLPPDCAAAAANTGIRELNTPYVALCEPGAWWAWGALTRAVRLLEESPRVAALNARLLRGAGREEDAACSALSRSPLPSPLMSPGTPRAAGCIALLPGAMVLRRCAFLSVGGYDTRFAPGAEERLLAYELMTAGWMLAYVPELLLHGPPPADASGEAGLARTSLHRQLCLAWARRPWRHALSESLRLFRGPLPVGERLPALCAALCSLPWVIRRRRALPQPVAAAVRRAELGAARAWVAPAAEKEPGGSRVVRSPGLGAAHANVLVQADFPPRRRPIGRSAALRDSNR